MVVFLSVFAVLRPAASFEPSRSFLRFRLFGCFWYSGIRAFLRRLSAEQRRKLFRPSTFAELQGNPDFVGFMQNSEKPRKRLSPFFEEFLKEKRRVSLDTKQSSYYRKRRNIACRQPNTACKQRKNADRRPNTACRRPNTACRRSNIVLRDGRIPVKTRPPAVNLFGRSAAAFRLGGRSRGRGRTAALGLAGGSRRSTAACRFCRGGRAGLGRRWLAADGRGRL